MRAFKCVDVASSTPDAASTSYLEADMRVVCYSSEWQSLVVLSALTIVFFSIGAPLAIFVVLRRARRRLGEATTFKRLGIMYESFKPKW